MSRAKPAGAYRVLHTADWHLGKLLGDLPRDEEHARFLDFLLEAIAAHEVDALVVAGDVFDAANPPQSALRQYYEFLSRLYRQCECAVVIVGGNHDSAAQLESPRDVLKPLRTTVVGRALDDPVVMLPDAEAPQLAVAALPFLRDRDLRSGSLGQGADEIRRALVDGISRRYREAAEAIAERAPGLPALATGHLTVAGGEVSESERQIHVGGLGEVPAGAFPDGFDYVALGHLHRPQPCRGGDRIWYSGSPIPLSFSESLDTKAVRVIDFAEGGMAGHFSIELPMWRRLVQMQALRSEVEEMLSRGVGLAGELKTWVEVVIEDPVAGENLVERVREAAAGQPFEVVRIVCKPRAAVAGLGGGDGAGEDGGRGELLLGDPEAVFRLRLEREEGIADGEREALELAFRQVIELRDEREGEPA